MMARMSASLDGRPVADAAFSGALPTGLTSWAGSGRIDLAGMPIDLLGAVAKSRTNGQLFGDVTVVTHGRIPSGTAIGAGRARRGHLQMDQELLGEGQLHVGTTGDLVRAPRCTSRRARGLPLDASGSAAVSFRPAIPTLGRDAPVRAHVTAHDFSAVALAPLVTGVLGRASSGSALDADLGVEFDPVPNADAGWTGGVNGTASIKDGSVLVDALGLEVRDLSASVEAHGSGAETNVSVRDVRTRASPFDQRQPCPRA